jgi:hypothetical protein
LGLVADLLLEVALAYFTFPVPPLLSKDLMIYLALILAVAKTSC